MGYKDVETRRMKGRESYYRHREERLREMEERRKNMSPEMKEEQQRYNRVYQHDYYLRNTDKCKMRSHLHWQKNKVRLNRTRNEFRLKLRQQAIQLLGGKCVQCGFSDFRGLAIDHIHGGGTKEARHVGTRKICHIIVTRPKEEWQDKYQCLCANCNWIKAYENEIRRVY